MIVSSDAAVVILAVLLAQVINVDADFDIDIGWFTEGFAHLFGAVVIVSWPALLAVEGVWDARVMTNKRAEVRGILLASLMMSAGVGIFGYLTMSDYPRSYLLIAVPVGVAGLIVSHWHWRRRFAAFRSSGGHRYGVRVYRDPRDIDGVTAQSGSRTVAVAPAQLLVADPQLLVAQPRLLVAEPRLSGRQMVAKSALDLLVAIVGILLLSPLLVAAAVLILLADGGPVLRQLEYVGRAGKVFKTWTFRCTPYGAKARPAAARASSGDARRAEYALATTSIGHLLRRTGLAGAPLLFNVLVRQMSVVGPRPSTPENFTPHPVAVRPGITGQWRVAARPADDPGNGFGDVENRSMTGDLKIIARTLKLAVTGRLPD